MKAWIGIVASLLFVGAARGGELEGTWEGQALGPGRDTVVTLIVKGERFELRALRNDGLLITVAGAIATGQAGTTKTVDLTGAEAKGGGKTIPLPDRLGIYEITGEEVRIRAGESRPNAVTGPEAEADPGYLRLTRKVGGD